MELLFMNQKKEEEEKEWERDERKKEKRGKRAASCFTLDYVKAPQRLLPMNFVCVANVALFMHNSLALPLHLSLSLSVLFTRSVTV